MNKKINVFLNGKYIYSTNTYKRCKDAIASLLNERSVTVVSVPANKYYEIKDGDKVTAFFDRSK